MDALELSRLQFAITTIFHFFFVPLSIGLAFTTAIMQTAWYRTKDPTYLLPLLLGITMIVTQRLQPQMMDKSQAFLITWVMPVFFTAIMLNYPAGLSLYIFTNNVLSIAQQFALRKYLERTGVATPKATVGKA